MTKILLVEDNEMNLDMLSRRLTRQGYVVVSAQDGAAGAAHAMAEDRDKAIAAGCDDYDTKPIDLPRLLAKIKKLLPEAGVGG